jgi:hypothetical protein
VHPRTVTESGANADHATSIPNSDHPTVQLLEQAIETLRDQ